MIETQDDVAKIDRAVGGDEMGWDAIKFTVAAHFAGLGQHLGRGMPGKAGAVGDWDTGSGPPLPSLVKIFQR